jgi:chromosome partitioning protein
MKTTIIIAVVNPKGGVGKSNTCKNLGRGLQKKGFEVLLGDTDPQASLNEWRLTDPDSDQPEVVVMANNNALLSEIAKANNNDLDFFIIDGMAMDFRMTMNLMGVANLVLLPLQPSPDDTVFLSELVNLVELNRLKRKGQPVAAFLLNLVDARENLTGKVKEALESLSLPILKTYIKRRSAFKNASVEGKTVYDKKGEDYQACVEMIDGLIAEILGLVK